MVVALRQPCLAIFITTLLSLTIVSPPLHANANAISSKWQYLKDKLFPNVEVVLTNDSSEDVMYMCKFHEKELQFKTLKARQTVTWNVRLYFFPTRWCYLYWDDNRHGFFWAFALRDRCSPCIWSIRNMPLLYRRDRGKWELHYLNPLPVYQQANSRTE